jgi:hypothetical protein
MSIYFLFKFAGYIILKLPEWHQKAKSLQNQTIPEKSVKHHFSKTKNSGLCLV